MAGGGPELGGHIVFLPGPVRMWQTTPVGPRGAAVPALAKLGDTMQDLPEAWQKWFDLETPETAPCPGPHKTLDALHRLLVLRAMRPDRLPAALKSFVAESLGPYLGALYGACVGIAALKIPRTSAIDAMLP